MLLQESLYEGVLFSCCFLVGEVSVCPFCEVIFKRCSERSMLIVSGLAGTCVLFWSLFDVCHFFCPFFCSKQSISCFELIKAPPGPVLPGWKSPVRGTVKIATPPALMSASTH